MGAKKDARQSKAEAKARAKALARSKRITEDIRAAKKSSKKKRKDPSPARWQEDPRDLLIAGPEFDLDGVLRDATPGWQASEKKAAKALASRGEDFSELQERLYAAGKEGARDSVLLILQGLDTSGKGGIVRHVVGQVDPQGVALAAFKTPTEEERAHDFLWRVRPRLPRPGDIGVFDRSHYEDLLVPTAQAMTARDQTFVVSTDELNRRYHDIYEMEVEAVRSGMRIIKVCLVVSYEEQGRRLAERLARPDKHWKFSTGDLDTRDDWEYYQRAYSEVIRRTSTRIAPWYVVPADHKWYARLAIQEILVRTLEDIDPQWPAADFDVNAASERLASTMTDEVLAEHASERTARPEPGVEPEDEPRITVDALGPVAFD